MWVSLCQAHKDIYSDTSWLKLLVYQFLQIWTAKVQDWPWIIVFFLWPWAASGLGMHLCRKAVVFFFGVFKNLLYLWNSWRVWRKEEWGIGWNRVLARFGRAAYGCFVPQAGSWLNSCFHSALSSVLFGKSGVSSSPPPALLWVGCSSPSLSPSSRIQPPQSHAPLAWLGPWCRPGPAPAILSIPCAKASSHHSLYPVCQGQLWSLLSSPHRRPGPRAGPTPTTLPSGRAAWTLLPAGLAICRWSTRRWGSTLSSLKTRSPSWGRSTETLNDSEDAAEGAEPPSLVWEPDCAAASERPTPPAASWCRARCSGLRPTAGRLLSLRLGRVQFHYGTLNNYFWNDCYAGLNFFNDKKKTLLKTEFFL